MTKQDRSIADGNVFERIAPCATNGFPQPGDRYEVINPWDTTTGLRAIGRTRGYWYRTESIESLADESKWKRIDMTAQPSMLDVLAEELADLSADFRRRA